MKRKKKILSSKRRASRARLIKRLSDRMAVLLCKGERHTAKFDKLDKQLERVQDAVKGR